jgi:beta-glucosidase
VGDGEDDERGRRRLAAALARVEELAVEVLVETHDSHRTGAAVAELLRPLVSRGRVGAVWDVLHTWRGGEPPVTTTSALGPLLRLVQVKDAAGPADTDALTLPGEGRLPVGAVLASLPTAGYAGWLSLEWERPWSPGLPDLDTALAATRRWLESALVPAGGAG